MSQAPIETAVRDFSGYRSIKYNLKVIFSCLTAIPFIVFAFIYFRIGTFSSALSSGLIVLSLILVLEGFIVFRRMAGHIEALSSTMSSTVDGKSSKIQDVGETRELAMIADTFNRTLEKLEDTARELGIRAVQISTLNEVRELVSKTIHTEKVANAVLEGAMRATGAEAGYLAVQRDSPGVLYMAAVAGIEGEVPKSLTLDSEDSLASRIVRTRSPILIKDMNEDPEMRKLNKPDLGLSQVLILPIIAKGASIGVLGVGKESKLTPFSGEDIQFLQTILHQVAYSFENARLYENLRQSHKELEKALESQKKAQDYLLSSVRMTAFGELSMNIANELNNPLTGILGYAELALQLDIDRELKESLEQIREQAVRAGRINKSLLDFAATKPGPKVPVDLNELIKKSLSIIQQNVVRQDITLDLRLADDSIVVAADKARLQEVFFNLINNAINAMTDEYGTPSESEKTIENKEKRLTIESGKRDTKAYVSFRDTGLGIEEDNLGRIFEPFFSTQNKTSQVGLGLWTSHSIIKAHGGVIRVKSVQGKGSIFTVVLPLNAED